MIFDNLSVRTRLVGLLFFVNALLVGAVAYGWYFLSKADEHLSRVIELQSRFTKVSEHVDRAQIEFKMEMLHFKNLLLRGKDAEMMERHVKGRAESARKMERELESAKDLSAGLGISADSVAGLLAKHRELGKVYERAIAAYRDGQSPNAIEASMRGDFFSTSDMLDQFSRSIDAQGERVARQIADSSSTEVRQRQIGLLMVTLMSVAASILAGWAIVSGILRPLNRAMEVAHAVAAGDLTTQIEDHGRNELGALLRSLKEMNEALTRIVSVIRADATSLMTASTQIAAGNQDLSSRTEEQASSLEETAASIEEMAATVKQNAEHSRKAHEIATSMSQSAEGARSTVSQVIHTMESIQKSSAVVADVTSLVDSIAFQTNILALNAAVEAARAGEQGRGFAVVAAEVRSLAQRSAQAAKEIRNLMAASTREIDNGARLANGAGESMAQVVASVEHVAGLVAEIAAATRAQSAGITQVNQAAANLENATQQNAALVEESASASESLCELARRMTESVATFTVNDFAQPVPASANQTHPKAHDKPALSIRTGTRYPLA